MIKKKWYYFDPETLSYKKVQRRKFLILIVLVLFITSGVSYRSGAYVGDKKHVEYIQLENIISIDNLRGEEFSPEDLKHFLVQLNLKFPHIVFAQAYLETGNFKSEIFIENHNLFGMKEAKLRPTTSIGTNLNHAYYNNWKESVYDYALYQSRYLGSIRSESDYYEYLDANYAEANRYVETLRNIIERDSLFQEFDKIKIENE